MIEPQPVAQVPNTLMRAAPKLEQRQQPILVQEDSVEQSEHTEVAVIDVEVPEAKSPRKAYKSPFKTALEYQTTEKKPVDQERRSRKARGSAQDTKQVKENKTTPLTTRVAIKQVKETDVSTKSKSPISGYRKTNILTNRLNHDVNPRYKAISPVRLEKK